MNINEEIQKATDKFVEEKLPEMVAAKVSSMMDGILSDVFRSYSDIGKKVKEKIEKGLDVNLQRYDLVDYNTLVSSAINNRLTQIVNENAINPIMQLVNETVGFVEQKKMKLSDIHEMIKEAGMENNEDKSEGEISFYAIKNNEHKWTTVSFDLDGNVPAEKCSVEFLISDSGGTIFSFKTKSYWSNRSNLTPSKVTQLTHLEHKIFRLYSAQISIEIDTTDFEYENQWNRYN